MKEIDIPTKIFNINAYIAIFLLFVVAGGSLPFMFYPRFFLFSFFVFSFLTRITSRVKLRWTSQYNYLLWLLFFMIISSLYNNSYDQHYKRILFVGFVSYVLLGSFTLPRFKHLYLDVVTIFCVVSLVIFSASLIVPLPLRYNYGDNVATGYFLFHAIEWNNHPLLRNASIYNEPGCFQYFLNYILLLHIEDLLQHRLKTNAIVKLVIVVIALLTCASTTGYFVLIAIITYILLNMKIKNKLVYFFFICPIAIFTFWNLYNSDSIKGKFETDNENTSFVMRAADAYAMIQMISDHPIIGNGGVSTSTYIKRVQGYGALTPDSAPTNGILVGVASMGFFWLFIFFFYSLKAIKKMFFYVPHWLVLILILLIHSNEHYIFFPITYVFLAFYHHNHNDNIPQKG